VSSSCAAEGGVKPRTLGSRLNVPVSVRGREQTRSCSPIGLPHGPVAQEVCRIAVKRATPVRGGSRCTWSLQTGAEWSVGEPNNHFEFASGAPRCLPVAEGIGVTPMVGIAQMLA